MYLSIHAFSRECQLVVRNVVKYIVIMSLCVGAPLVGQEST